ncbi:MAG: hypothetical protein ACRDLA_10575 [Thermoleophilaceae bacterium]
MDLRRLRAGEWMAAVSGAALVVALFVPWYEAGGETLSAWRSFALIDVLLALVALTTLALPVLTAGQRVPAVPIALSAFVTIAGLIGVLLVLFRAANLPGAAEGREWGLWLALAAAAGVVAAGAVAMRDERLSPAGRDTDLTGRPTPPPPEIERLRAPRPE